MIEPPQTNTVSENNSPPTQNIIASGKERKRAHSPVANQVIHLK